MYTFTSSSHSCHCLDLHMFIYRESQILVRLMVEKTINYSNLKIFSIFTYSIIFTYACIQMIMSQNVLTKKLTIVCTHLNNYDIITSKLSSFFPQLSLIISIFFRHFVQTLDDFICCHMTRAAQWDIYL